jgi:hypothetical protein
MADPELMLLALLTRMVETGALDMDDINAVADALEPQDADGAHQVRMAGIMGSIGEPETEADHQAAVRRRSIRLVDPDGGKPNG